jgi:hypothetical protein
MNDTTYGIIVVSAICLAIIVVALIFPWAGYFYSHYLDFVHESMRAR